MEQKEDRKRDEVVREREVEHMAVRGSLGENLYECNILDFRLLTQCHVKESLETFSSHDIFTSTIM